VFTESAAFYDVLYSFVDYEAAVRDIAARLDERAPHARSLLDVGCGTGRHLELLRERYEVEGLDLNPTLLALARERCPDVPFHEADMADFDLDRSFDVVICMFSSIGYVKTLPELQRTLQTFRRHLAPGGVVIVEPWFPPEVMKSGHQSIRSAEAGAVRVERVGNIEVEGRLSRLQFDYTIHEGDRVRQTTELHELGLFTVAETLDAFSVAGLRAEHHAPSERNRGLYIARASDQWTTADPR
jgi:SAM-dependent methyltransferase